MVRRCKRIAGIGLMTAMIILLFGLQALAEAPTTPAVDFKAETVKGLTTKMEYSFDEGDTYTKATSATLKLTEDMLGSTLFVRFMTDELDVQEIDIPARIKDTVVATAVEGEVTFDFAKNRVAVKVRNKYQVSANDGKKYSTVTGDTYTVPSSVLKDPAIGSVRIRLAPTATDFASEAVSFDIRGTQAVAPDSGEIEFSFDTESFMAKAGASRATLSGLQYSINNGSSWTLNKKDALVVASNLSPSKYASIWLRVPATYSSPASDEIKYGFLPRPRTPVAQDRAVYFNVIEDEDLSMAADVFVVAPGYEYRLSTESVWTLHSGSGPLAVPPDDAKSIFVRTPGQEVAEDNYPAVYAGYDVVYQPPSKSYNYKPPARNSKPSISYNAATGRIKGVSVGMEYQTLNAKTDPILADKWVVISDDTSIIGGEFEPASGFMYIVVRNPAIDKPGAEKRVSAPSSVVMIPADAEQFLGDGITFDLETERIIGVERTMEYRPWTADTSAKWKPVSGTSIDVSGFLTDGVDSVEIRLKAVSGANAVKPSNFVEVSLNNQRRAAPTGIEFDYVEETLILPSGLDPENYQFSTDLKNWKALDIAAIAKLIPAYSAKGSEKTVYIREAPTSSTVGSQPAIITLVNRPAKPSFKVSVPDGAPDAVIDIGDAVGLEYRTNDDDPTDWQSFDAFVDFDEVLPYYNAFKLTYYIRVKATSETPASLIQTISVSRAAAPKVTRDTDNEVFRGATASMEYRVDGTGDWIKVVINQSKKAMPIDGETENNAVEFRVKASGAKPASLIATVD